MSQSPLEGFRPSLQQARHWRLNQGIAGCAFLRVEPSPSVAPEQVRAALSQLLARHEILRTRLTAVPGLQLPVQVIADNLDFTWQTVSVDGPDAETALQAELASSVQRADQPALAAALLDQGGSRRVLLALPAANADIASLEVLRAELAAICQGKPLDDEPVQYADFAEWQHELSQDPDSEAGRAFWQRQKAEDLLTVTHPFQGARTDQPYRSAQVHQTLSAAENDQLLSALTGLGLQPAALFGLCWAALLQRHLGMSRVLIGWDHDGRNSATRAALGPYAKQLPLLLALDEDKPLAALAGEFDALYAEADACQESWPGEAAALPFGFAFRRTGSGSESLIDLAVPGEPNMLRLEVRQHGERFDFTLHHDAARVTEQAATLVLDQFLTLSLQASIGGRPLRQADGLSAAQRSWLASLNRTDVGLQTPPLLHQLFEAQAARRPEALALVAGQSRLSYKELDAHANRLAHRLLRQGLQPGQPVGLFLGRGADAIVAILGILKAGGAYLPLDPSYPGERLADMLEQTRAPLLLSIRALEHKLPAGDYQTLWLDESEALPTHSPALTLPPEQLAYLIFTSGSTGRPKGVMVSHRNAVHSTSARWHGYREPLSGFLLVSGLSFDSSVAGLFWTLSQGGTLCLPQDAEVQDAGALARLIAEQHISHTLMLPSLYAQVLEQPNEPLGSLRCAIVAGEACQSTVAARHAQICPQAALYNEYGPTEGSVWCSLYRSQGGERGVLPIGKPIANMRLWVLDEALEPVAPGVAGEIYLSGAGITLGYLDRPALTAERFLPDPFGNTGGRLYRSGDIGRWNANGELEFLGRVDHQVKIRGFRIELGEIEARLLEHPAVREAVVIARPDPAGDTELVAYLVARDACPCTQALSTHLAEQLPAHMLPSAYVTLPTLPLTPNGKLDRAALPAPERSSQRPYREPRSARESQVAALWAEVLGVARVGLDDHFFELGGHSLTATRLISRLRGALGLEVPVRALFQQPTLQAFVEQALPSAQAPALPAIEPVVGDAALPQSYAQERLWLFDRLHAGSTAYHVAEAVRLTGTLDHQALERSFSELLRRHASLRTCFALEGDQPVQRIQPLQPFPLPLLDLSALSEVDRQSTLRTQLDALALQAFDLARGPLIRAGLIRLGQQEHVLWLCLHHIVTDGWSMRVFTRELETLYSAFSKGQASPLAEPVLQYADYAFWQRRHLDATALKPQLDFWLSHLGQSRQPLQLAGMRPRPALLEYRGAQFKFLLDAGLMQDLHTFCRQRGVTLYMAMLAAFQLLLSGHSGQDDLRIGIPIANRQRQELEGLVGFFVNTLALRGDLSGDPAFVTLLEQVRDNLLAAQGNQDLPFEQLLQALGTHSTPLLQVMFDLHQERILTSDRFADLAIEPLQEGSTHSTLFDLMLDIGEREHGLVATFTYSTELFEEGYIALLAADYERLLRAILARPDARSSELRRYLNPPSNDLSGACRNIEGEVSTLLSELLGCQQLDLEAGFFELGGTSLKAVLLSERLRRRWGTAVPPQLVFLHPKLSDLLKALKPYARQSPAS